MNEQILSSPQQRFLEQVRAYIALIENHTTLEDEIFFTTCAKTLANLYSASLDLADVEPCESIADESPVEDVTPAVQDKLRGLAERLPSTFDLLYDDLHDVYVDLQLGLSMFDRGEPCALINAMWEWKFTFVVHWGKHLTHALSILHQLILEPSSHA